MATETVTVKGLSADVEIRRDKWGIPAIFGKTDMDVYFGWGYAMAEDRLFQMEIMRRRGSGRMAELLGEKHIESDKRHRRLYLQKYFHRSLK